MSLTAFPGGISSFGVPVFGSGGLIPAPGKVFFVNQETDASNTKYPGSDSNTGLSPKRPMATLSAVHDKMTADQNDTVIVMGSTASIAVREQATLVWSKDMCHIVGAMSHNRISHRVSIRAASGYTFTPLVNVTADGCVFANFHAYHGYDAAVDQVCWAEAGERNAYYNVHLVGMQNATPAERAGSRTLTLTGDGERYFKDCVIGGDTVPRDGSAEIGFASAAVRDVFEDCIILSYTKTGQTDNHLVRAATSGAIDRFCLFKGCTFVNTGAKAGGGTMAEAFDVHSTVGGAFLVQGCSFFGITDVESATVSGNVLINTWLTPAADMGVGTTTVAA